MLTMFALVKFCCDGELNVVPVNYIKNFELSVKENEKCEVFWSPNAVDTPQSVLKKQRQIPSIDSRLTRTPVPGYYLAEILLTANSEEELDMVTENRICRKVLTSLMKEDNSNSKTQPKEEINKDTPKHGKRKKLYRSVDHARKKQTVTMDVSSESETDDMIMNEITPYKDNTEKLKELKEILVRVVTSNESCNVELIKKYTNVKQKYVNLKKQYKTVLQLNLELQKQLISKQGSYIKIESAAENNVLDSSTSNLSTEDVISDQNASNVTIISPEKVANKTNQMPSTSNLTTEDVSSDQDSPKFIFSPVKVANKTSQMDVFLPGTCYLTPETLLKVKARVKPGRDGDSMYVKSLCCALFTVDTLFSSSVSGLKCRAKKDAQAKPPLCPLKLKYLKDLFVQRILEENPAVDEREKKKRCSKVNTYISEKIQTIVRYRK